MEVENDMPKCFIVSETKINTQSLDAAIHEVNKKNWSDEWKKRNQNSNISDVEKLGEALAEISGKYVNDTGVTTGEYNKIMSPYTQDECPFRHIEATVAFVNVSRDFAFIFRELGGRVSIGDMNYESLTFWVPPAFMVNDSLAIEYGKTLADIGQKIESIRKSAFEEKVDHPTKIMQGVDGMYPSSVAINMIATASIPEWKRFILKNAGFHNMDEARFMLMTLTRLMKMKWSSVFYDLVVEDNAGKQYGLDTINVSSMAFKSLRIAFKHPDDSKENN
jgi:hypothetical protein